MSEIRTQLRTAVISAPDDGCKGLWGEIARHVDLSGFFPLTLLLQTGEVLGASRQNQLVHLGGKVVDTENCCEMFLPLSERSGLESEG